MTHTPEEQSKAEPVVEKAVVKTPEVLSFPQDILGKEYEFNGVSFTVLGMEPVFFGDDDVIENLQSDTVAFVNIQKQRIPVIPFQGGMARVTKIRIGNEVITDYVEIIKNILIVEQAPDGWITNGRLADKLGSSAITIVYISNFYRQQHPEWFRKYRAFGGQIREYYSPQLCDVILNEISKKEQAPKGWMTNRALANELIFGQATITRYANRYRQSNPELFHKYLDKKGHYREHYSLWLCDKIRSELSHIKQTPEGWMTKWSLRKELKLDMVAIENYAKQYYLSHPDWFHWYKSSNGRILKYYSPKLCDLIRKKFSQREYAPEDWMTNSKLAREFKRNFTRIKLLANTFRLSNPDWFHWYTPKSGSYSEHYSPELCDLIRQAMNDKRS